MPKKRLHRWELNRGDADPWPGGPESGSIRQFIFSQLEAGKTWPQLAEENRLKRQTVRRYFYQWSHGAREFAERYASLKCFLAQDPRFRLAAVKQLARQLGLTEDQVSRSLSQPWGLHRLMRLVDKALSGTGDRERCKVQDERLD